MGRAGLARVAVSAPFRAVRARVGLVAAGAVAVTSRRGGVYLLVTRGALGYARPGVRLVTASARRVSRHDLRVLLLVATVAAREQRFGTMRQAAMAAGAGLVPGIGCDLLHARGVTVATGHAAGRLDPEVVRPVAPDAGDAAVCRVVTARDLMASAAALVVGLWVSAARVRIVAANTAAVEPWMVRVHAAVATLAGLSGSALNGVRGMAAVATLVCGDARAAEHGLVLMARATVHGLRRLEGVRLMATETLAMSTSKKRALWNLGLVLRVTVDAGGPR
jgi:hypothetical protein